MSTHSKKKKKKKEKYHFFLARLNNIHGELLYYPRRRCWRRCPKMLKFFVKVFKTLLFPYLITELIHFWFDEYFAHCKSYSHFFSKNTCELDIILIRTVNILTTNKLVKLTMLWTAGPRTAPQMSFCCCQRHKRPIMMWLKYSRLSLSRLRLSRITAYLEVKIGSQFLHENLTTGNKLLWKRGEIAPKEQFLLFSTIFSIYL